jgi:hypothetical protein
MVVSVPRHWKDRAHRTSRIGGYSDLGAYYRNDSDFSPEAAASFEQETLDNVLIALQLYKPWDKTLLPTVKRPETPLEDSRKRRVESEIWNITPFIRKRRFIVVDGVICGIGPQRAEVGDLGVAVPGSPVPLIFRKRSEGDGYVNMGDAYIEGFMTGKAVEDVEEGKCSFEVFDLH